MTKKVISTGVVHKVPADLRKVLTSSSNLRDVWNDLTPLSRNEWICWVSSVKKPETRKYHIKRLYNEVIKGKRRPCCWAGCPHR
ncbi:MAG: YdeI/OmpD-associated family protein [Nanoarchaeota archaeon]